MNKQITVLLSLAMLFSINAKAQLDSLMDLYVTEFDSVAGFMYFNPDQQLAPGTPYAMYQAYTGDTMHKLVLKKQWEDQMLGMQHYRYQETFRNLRVEAAEYTEHANPDGYLVLANGKIVNFDMDMSAQPIVNEEEALTNLLDSFPENEFAWDDGDWEQELKDETENEDATYYPKGELMWALEDYKDLTWNIPVSKYHLAWRFDILSLNPSFHKAFYVDAITGQVFREEQLRCSNGPANILTQGSQTIDTRYYGGLTQKYILWADDNGRDIHTKYAGATWLSWGTAGNIKDKDDNWGNSEQHGTTAHWMASQSWDFYASTPFNRNGIDGNGGELRIKVDYTADEGAFYTPDGNDDYLLIGDLDGNYTAVIDVVGHEYTHGVDEYTADLTYQDESGALDESFADIFGFMVEEFTEGSASDWLIGEDGNFTVNHTRSLEDPNSWGEHITAAGTLSVGQPDTYEGTFWYTGTGDYGGVHVNSGVQNFWFYLLADGGIGTNDNGDGYNIQGIGIDDAARIAYWSHTNILQSGAQYADARAGAITAAQLIFGNCSNEEIQTTNAWAAVGVGNQTNCTGTGIANTSFEKPMLYPNPATDEVIVSFLSPKERVLQLYSINGSLIRELGTINDRQLRINTSNMAKGVYLLKILEGNQFYTIKLVKN